MNKVNEKQSDEMNSVRYRNKNKNSVVLRVDYYWLESDENHFTNVVWYEIFGEKKSVGLQWSWRTISLVFWNNKAEVLCWNRTLWKHGERRKHRYSNLRYSYWIIRKNKHGTKHFKILIILIMFVIQSYVISSWFSSCLHIFLNFRTNNLGMKKNKLNRQIFFLCLLLYISNKFWYSVSFESKNTIRSLNLLISCLVFKSIISVIKQTS